MARRSPSQSFTTRFAGEEKFFIVSELRLCMVLLGAQHMPAQVPRWSPFSRSQYGGPSANGRLSSLELACSNSFSVISKIETFDRTMNQANS